MGKPDGGPECEAFERELERYYDIPHARVMNSATSAIHAALVAVGVRRNDEVIVPGYSMSASAAAILHAGAVPVFADIGDDYCLDWDDVRHRITERTATILLVHLFGRHAEVPPDITIPVVHDAAQSPSLRPATHVRNPQRVGDIWVYSLNQWKIVTCGEGGYALTFSKRLADRLHAVRNHGECTTDDILGWNYRMTEMEAAIARHEFADLDNRLAERRKWAATITSNLSCEAPPLTDWFLYPIRVPAAERDDYARLVGGRAGYHKPIYRLPYFARQGYGNILLHNVEAVESELVVIDPLATWQVAAA